MFFKLLLKLGIKKCKNCKGKGKISCHVCEEDIILYSSPPENCLLCNGEKVIQCEECKGSGKE